MTLLTILQLSKVKALKVMKRVANHIFKLASQFTVKCLPKSNIAQFTQVKYYICTWVKFHSQQFQKYCSHCCDKFLKAGKGNELHSVYKWTNTLLMLKFIWICGSNLTARETVFMNRKYGKILFSDIRYVKNEWNMQHTCS